MPMTEHETKLKAQIEVLKFLPPSLLAQVVIEANEARGDKPDEECEVYILQIEAAFEIEAVNNGFADFAREIIRLAYAEGKASAS